MNYIYKSEVKKKHSPIHFKQGLLFIFVCLMTLMLTTCKTNPTGSSDYDDNGNNGGNNEQTENEVSMIGMSFSPANLEVTAGTEVTWRNESSLIHTVTSGTPGSQDGMFDSGNVSPDETFSYTFSTVGTYDYFCIPHQPNMTGTITVVAN